MEISRAMNTSSEADSSPRISFCREMFCSSFVWNSRALAYSDIADMIPLIRKPIDALEEIVDNATWPLPKYRELLFIS